MLWSNKISDQLFFSKEQFNFFAVKYKFLSDRYRAENSRLLRSAMA